MKSWLARQLVLLAIVLDSNLLKTSGASDDHGFAKTKLDRLLNQRELRKREHVHRSLDRFQGQVLADAAKRGNHAPS